MARSGSRLAPFYGLHATAVEVDADGATVTLRHTGGEVSTIRAKYVVGCDGARSAVRAAIGRELVGDATDEAWGVMDVLAVTDFPDIRVKAAITSANGNILIIPREGGYLVRFYIELDEPETGAASPWSSSPRSPIASCTRTASRSKTSAGGRCTRSASASATRFDDVPAGEERLPRVFIAGDACHTHSAKAGQGMNVSMADAWNLGWKLAAVLRGRRQAGAAAHLLPGAPGGRHGADRLRPRVLQALPRPPGAEAVDPETFQRYFVAQGRFTAGVATTYGPSLITGDATHPAARRGLPDRHALPLGAGDPAGRRQADAARPRRPRRRGLAGLRLRRPRASSRAGALCEFLGSVIRRFTPAGADPDAVIDLRAVFQQGHRELAVDELPPVLLPRKGRFGLIDYEKAFCPDPAAGHLRAAGRRPRATGAMVVVRPDQYVAHVLPLDARDALAEFFARDPDQAGTGSSRPVRIASCLLNWRLRTRASTGWKRRAPPVSWPCAPEREPGAALDRVERDPQVHRRSLDDPQRERAARLELGDLDDRDELLAARGAVHLAQAGADADRPGGLGP